MIFCGLEYYDWSSAVELEIRVEKICSFVLCVAIQVCNNFRMFCNNRASSNIILTYENC